MINRLKHLFKKTSSEKIERFSVFSGSKNEIDDKVTKLINEGWTIKHTSICQGFSSYGNEKPFVIAVTYVKNKL